ncbi:starch phosphorylase [Marinimicrobium koreense]|uniref:Starch phosphorylase n=3 Tax=Marinimicrobium TaxID=359337 RepID=A0A3N1NPE0_9GAMM|nr:alpha-glucan family phosphorylase [Marinimicrobium koreense]ROQ20722.1 starch phosphorylase [Marinimicrobium koreense]
MALSSRPLPEALAILRELSLDLYWSWNHDGDQLWQQLNPEVWEHTQNPVEVLQLTSDEQLQKIARDKNFLAALNTLTQARDAYLTDTSWYQQHYANSALKGIAYLSMEYGLCDALPLYAGGLGMLAGDYLKTASDLGVPVVAVGLLYQQGYFHQSLDDTGWQRETYLYNDPGSLPLRRAQAKDGSWLHIDTEFLCRRVRFRVWQVTVGRITLYLLDSNDPRNQAGDRGITSQLYGGNRELRLVQEIALGICGWRLLDTLGCGDYVCHLNEGHAAFATLERMRTYCERHKVSFDEALWATRAGNIFTTHTPVAAGFDRYPIEVLRRYIDEFSQQLGVPAERLLALGKANPEDSTEWFNMAWLAMRTCAFANGVSALHGAVSRTIFQPLFPRWPEREVPIGHVTNGVHVPTWDSSRADNEWRQLFGPDRWRQDLERMPTDTIEQLDNHRLWQMKGQGRAQLVDYVRRRLGHQWRRESDPGQCAVFSEQPLDPNVLTLGFARRFAEYKRPNLLLHNPDRLAALLNHPQHPVQLIVAGKAHPADQWGKNALQAWYRFARRADVKDRVVFLEDYDIELAQHLVQGVDVWLNTPRRPWEACGTSGMKVLVNGGLNLSSLDGWWAEAWHAEVGWALGDGDVHGEEQDDDDATALYELLEQDIAPCFYHRDDADIPTDWLERVRHSMAQLTASFSCNRMLQEYIEGYYLPAAQLLANRTKEKGALAAELFQWHSGLSQHWHEIHLGELQFDERDGHRRVGLNVQLGGLNPEHLTVELIADPTDAESAITLALTPASTLQSATHSYRYEGQLDSARPDGDFTARVVPRHPAAMIPAEHQKIIWQSR